MDTVLESKLNQALALHNYRSALNYCLELTESGDDSAKLRAVQGWCLYQLSDIKQAENLLVSAFNQNSKDHFIASMTIAFYMERGEYQQVVRLGQYCVGQHADDRLMWHRLGTAQFLLGDLTGSEIAFRRSLTIEHTDSSAFALSQTLLCQGNYSEGLRLYEYRFGAYSNLNWPQSERMPMPKWQGEPLQGKSLLVWTEQGLGDCIQFSRLVSLVTEHGATVDLMMPESHAGLVPIMELTEGVSNLTVIQGREISLHRRYDFQSPLLSLMRWFEIDPATIPSKSVSYLDLSRDKPSSIVQRQLKSMSSNTRQLKIGIVWTTALLGSFKDKDFLNYLQKERKSIASDEIRPILKIGDEFKFYSLHVEKSPAIQALLDTENITDLAPSIANFADTAHLINALDLVISIDTSVAHLAGALNKPVINLLPFAADWRWQNNREDSPWYPSMRLLRQAFRGDWSTVICRLENLLMKTQSRFEQTDKVEIFL